MIDPVLHYAHVSPLKRAAVDLESGQTYTYQELNRAINQCAHWLVAELGPYSKKRVAVVAKNSIEILLMKLACVRAGAIFAPLNWRLTDDELGVIFENCDPDLYLTDMDKSPPNYTGRRFSLIGAVQAAVKLPHQIPDPEWRQNWRETSLLLYTSGTSGKPKGVMLSEENCFWSSTNFIHGFDVSARNVFLCDMPMFHTAGLLAAVRTPLLTGGTVLISDGFNPARTLARISDPKLGVTNYFSVPQMAQMMWNEPGFKPEMLSGLDAYTTGGAPNPKVLKERFVTAGIMMSDGFGMTETGSNFAMPIHDKAILLNKTGSCGVPHIGITARVVDGHGNPVGADVSGELWIKGPSVTRGYYKNKSGTAEAFEGEWFKTGDVALYDADGFYYLVDRKKDMFISGGENVYPAEVEAVILRMGEIAEIAVIGVEDEKWGEVGCAFYTWVDGQEKTSEQIQTHCAKLLAKYKVPKHYVEIFDIPKTGSGKVKKHELKKIWTEEKAAR